MTINAIDAAMKTVAGGKLTNPDNTPDPFAFVDRIDVAASTPITSAPITVTGIDSFTTPSISVVGGEYNINGGAFTAVTGTVGLDDLVSARHTSAAGAGSAVNTTVTIDIESDTFTSTTATGGLPLVTLGNIVFQGAFNVPKTKGIPVAPNPVASTEDNGNSTGNIGKSRTGHFFMNAHVNYNVEGLGEFTIPPLVDDPDYLQWNTAVHTQEYVQGHKFRSIHAFVDTAVGGAVTEFTVSAEHSGAEWSATDVLSNLGSMTYSGEYQPGPGAGFALTLGANNVSGSKVIDGQTEADYDGVGGNGTFTAGTGYITNFHASKEVRDQAHVGPFLSDLRNDLFGTTMIRPSDGALLHFINEYYGASNDINSVYICDDPTDIVNPVQWRGVYQVETNGGASNVRAARWAVPIPAEWQTPLGGPWLFGSGMGLANKGRQSIGPCAFAFDPDDVGLHTPSFTSVGANQAPSIRLLDYYLNPDQMIVPTINGSTVESLDTANAFWTQESFARLGWIVPNSSTYIVLGKHAGLLDDIAYKFARRVDVGGDSPIHHQTEINYDGVGNNGVFSGGTGYSVDDDITLIVPGSDGHILVTAVGGGGTVTGFQVDGERIDGLSPGQLINTTSVLPAGGSGFTLTVESDNLGIANGGYGPIDPDDIYWYYWMFDVNDMVDVKNGVINSYDVVPYEKGHFPLPYDFEEFSAQGVEFEAIDNPGVWDGSGFWDDETDIFYIALTNYNSWGSPERVPSILGFKVVL